MPTFSHREVDPSNEQLLAQIYQLGIDSQLPAEIGCTAIPYPTQDSIKEVMSDESLHRYTIYADNTDLRVALAFDDEGNIRFCISKPWLGAQALAALAVNPANPVHPNGVQQAKYVYDLVRTETGSVRSFNGTSHAAVLKLHRDNAVTVVELDSVGNPTGREKRP